LPDPVYVKAIVWSENILLGIGGLLMVAAPMINLSSMITTKGRVILPDTLLSLAGVISLVAVAFNLAGSAIGAIAGEPPHFFSQFFFAIVVGGAAKLHSLEQNQLKLGVDVIFFIMAVVAAAPTAGYGLAAGSAFVGAAIGFLLGTCAINPVKAREVQPESDYYIRA